VRQIDRLLEYAAAEGLAPVYALYNGPQLNVAGRWSCQGLAELRELMGVGLLAAETARYQLNFATNGRHVSQDRVTT